MPDPDLVLWSDSRFCSPWVLSVFAAMKEKEIPFSIRTIDLERQEHRKGEYPERTLTAKVPAIQGGGAKGDLWIAESLAILEYLEEAYTPPKHRALYPPDIVERARDRQILCWLRSDLEELRRCMPFEGILLGGEAPELTPRAREQADRLLFIASARLRARRNAEPTLADFDLAYALRRLIHYRYDLGRHADLTSYADRIWNRPSVKAWRDLERPARA